MSDAPIEQLADGDEVMVTFVWGLARGRLQGTDRLWLGDPNQSGLRVRTAHRRAARGVLAVQVVRLPDDLLAELYALIDSWKLQRDRLNDLNRECYEDIRAITADTMQMCAGRLAEVVATSAARAKASS